VSAPSPALLRKLGRAKLLTRWAVATVGHGERRSKQKGAGMEFADHREYQMGDDTRHLDTHVHARLGKNYIKQYDVYQQLPITVIVDGSRSMDFGSPNKFQFAASLASVFGFLGLNGGDLVRIGVTSGDKIVWSPKFHGAQRAPHLFKWMDKQRPSARGSLGTALREAVRSMTNRGLVILLSDMWSEDVEAAVAIIAASGQEVWGIHVLTREEVEPESMGDGDVRMLDMETGHEVEIALDRSVHDRYHKALEAWSGELQTKFSNVKGRYLLVPSDQSAEKLLLQEWRALGMIAAY
jgi:hypothetical protein